MPGKKVLAFEPSNSFAAQARQARRRAIERHRTRQAMLDIAWRLRQAATADIAEQDPQAIKDLQHYARLLIKIPPAKPIKMLSPEVRAAIVARVGALYYL